MLLLINVIVVNCKELMLFYSRNCWLLVCVTPLERCSSVSPSAAPFLAVWSRIALGSNHKYGTSTNFPKALELLLALLANYSVLYFLMSLCQMAGLVSALVTLTILLKISHLLEQLPRVRFTLDSKKHFY